MLFFALFAACADTEGLYAACDEQQSDIDGAEETSLGFAAADVWAWANAESTDTLRMADGTDDRELTVTVAQIGGATFVDQTDVSASDTGGAEPAIESVCEDYLMLQFSVGFATADGAFAESWTANVPFKEVGYGATSVPVALDTFAGTYAIPTDLTDGCTESHLQVDLYLRQDGGNAGYLWVSCETDDGETTSDGLRPLAEWGDTESL